ncbi:hypothetical protein [Azospirillum lipoferum]|uniref:hypothetical protein n=1 Tax=Azospirillum lipoferum TaxID=193 RepID=UPI00139627DB|nr:hypothetical protein [Azospirillum lipoferum]
MTTLPISPHRAAHFILIDRSMKNTAAASGSRPFSAIFNLEEQGQTVAARIGRVCRI